MDHAKILMKIVILETRFIYINKPLSEKPGGKINFFPFFFYVTNQMFGLVWALFAGVQLIAFSALILPVPRQFPAS
jgi:hypothetical protein